MSDGTIEILPAESAEDLASVASLFTAYVSSLGIDLTYQNYAEEYSSLPGKYSPSAGGVLLLAFRTAEGRAKEVLGCVAVRSLGDGICEGKRLYVKPEGRGSGAGEALIRNAVTKAKQMGYREMRLDTLSSMTKARMLYEKLGFVEIGSYYETPVEDTVFMALKLDNKL